LTIKREPPPSDRPDVYLGVSSNYFHDQVNVGSRLLAKAPQGTFTLNPNPQTPAILISAGVGLTPLASMLNAIVEEGSERPTWFIHGAKTRREQAMGDHIRKLAREKSNVHVHIRYSNPSPGDKLGSDYDDAGHVDIELVKHFLPTNDFDVYLCGPATFMKSLMDGLIECGVPEVRIHYEFFDPASALKDRKKVSTPKRVAQASQCC
jgi:ferredoxin-NADP reductase